MKLKKLLLLPLLAAPLMVASCVSGGGTTSSSGGDSSSSGGGGGSKNLLMKFFSDYNHYDEEEPYLSVWWYYDQPFSKADIGLNDPTEVPDPYYPTFLGWSIHPVVDEDQYLWNFGKDVVTTEMAVGGEIEFFGIFVGK